MKKKTSFMLYECEIKALREIARATDRSMSYVVGDMAIQQRALLVNAGRLRTASGTAAGPGRSEPRRTRRTRRGARP